MNNYTYEQYLEKWESLYGEAEQGESLPTICGKLTPVVLPKLRVREFLFHLSEFERLNTEFGEFGRDVPLEDIDSNLAESFPHELVLLV
jgi:hypothetical protein